MRAPVGPDAYDAQVAGAATALVGRDSEREVIGNFLKLLRDGVGSSVLIQGEPGIGKTALVQYARALAQPGLRVLSGSARRLERDRPFGLMEDALASDPQLRARSVSVLAKGSPTLNDLPQEGLGAQWQIVDTVADLVETAATEEPLLMILDDLHWADSSSIIAVSHLIHRIQSASIGLLISRRLNPTSPELDALVEELIATGTSMLTLRPLTQEQVDKLIQERLPRLRRAEATKYVARSGGNPLYVQELLSFFEQESSLDPSELPADLRALINRRLRSLESDVVDCLRVAAVLGARFNLDDLVIALQRPATSLMRLVDKASKEGLVAAEAGDLVFRHELVRDAIYEEIAYPVRTSLHREIGRALAESGAPALRVAPHMALAAQVADAEAISWLQSAAAEAMKSSPQVAIDVLRRALDLTLSDDPARAAIQTDLVASLTTVGRAGDARAIASEALTETIDEGLQRSLQVDIARCFYMEARYGEAADAYQALIDQLRPLDVRSVSLLTEASVACTSAHRLGEAEELLNTARALGSASDDPAAQLRTWRAARLLDDYRYRSGASTRFAEEAAEAIEAGLLGDEEKCHFHFYRGIDLHWVDKYEESVQMLRVGRRFAEETGRVWHLPRLQTALGEVLFQGGDWDDALAELEAGVVLANEMDSRWGIVELYGSLVAIFAHRGEFPDAHRVLELGEARADQGDRGAEWLLPVRIALSHLEGDRDGAAGLIDALADSLDDHVVAGFNEVFTPDVVRAAILSDRVEYGERIAAAVQDVAGNNQLEFFTGIALRCRGILDDDADTLTRSVESFSRETRSFLRGLACEDAAFSLARAGRSDEMDPYVTEAAAIYAHLGAAQDEQRLRAYLPGTGAKPLAAKQMSRPRFGWESLTASEKRVVALVAEGKSNPEVAKELFVSRYTVATHLRHVFEKLGVTSRTQLAAEAVRRATSATASGINLQE